MLNVTGRSLKGYGRRTQVPSWLTKNRPEPVTIGGAIDNSSNPDQASVFRTETGPMVFTEHRAQTHVNYCTT